MSWAWPKGTYSMRWFYYYPTWMKPSGGNKQIRLMASLLSDLGVEAWLLRDRKFFEDPDRYDDNSFYGVPVPNASFPFEEGGQNLHPDDVVILPEVVLGKSLDVSRQWRCRFALYNQNGFYGLRYGAEPEVCGRRLEFVITIAPYIASLCKTFLGIPSERIFHVPVWSCAPRFPCKRQRGPKTWPSVICPGKCPIRSSGCGNWSRGATPTSPGWRSTASRRLKSPVVTGIIRFSLPPRTLRAAP